MMEKQRLIRYRPTQSPSLEGRMAEFIESPTPPKEISLRKLTPYRYLSTTYM
jgi:hypothetical protein